MALLKDHLIAHYKLNDDAATAVVIDETGDHGGTYKDVGGDLNTDTGASTGRINGALDFDGDEYIEIAQTEDFNFGSENFAISLWFYPTVESRQSLIGSGSSVNPLTIWVDFHSGTGTRTINIWASSNGASWNMIHSDAGGEGVGTISLILNTWNHIIFMRVGDQWRTYINTVLDKDVTASGTVHAIDSTWELGRQGSYGFGLVGLLDNVMIFNTDVTLNEIKALYNHGVGRETIPIGIELSRTGHSFASRQEM